MWGRWLRKFLKGQNKKHLFVQRSIDIDIQRKYHKFMKQEEHMR